MLLPISSVNNINAYNYNTKASKHSLQLKKDSFERTIPINFQAVKVKEIKKYNVESINSIKKELHIDFDTWKKMIKKRFVREAKDAEPEGMSGYYDEPFLRYIEDFASLGVNELVIACRRLADISDAKNHAEKYAQLRLEIESWKTQEKIASEIERDEHSKNNLLYKKELNNTMENEVAPKLLYLIQRVYENKNTEMPNCVMLSHKDNQVNNDIMEQIKKQICGKYEQLNNPSNLLKTLESAEEHFQNTGEWSIIQVDGMEDLINPSKSENWQIEGMKGLMSTCAQDYHATLLFVSQNPKELDNIALQPHRVKKINTDNITSEKELNSISAARRLNDRDIVETTPIATMNLLLDIAKITLLPKMDWNYTRYNLEKTSDILQGKLTDKKYLDILNETVDTLHDIYS